MPAMRRRPVHSATSLPLPSLIVASSHGEPSCFGTMRTATISPTMVDGSRAFTEAMGSTPGWLLQNSRSCSWSRTSTGAVSLWSSFLSAIGDLEVGVEHLVVQHVSGLAQHDQPHLGAIAGRLDLDVVHQRADQGYAEAALEVEPLGVGYGRVLGQRGRVEPRASVAHGHHESLVALAADDRHGLDGRRLAVRLDGVRTRLGHRDLEVVDALVGEVAPARRNGRHDKAR